MRLDAKDFIRGLCGSAAVLAAVAGTTFVAAAAGTDYTPSLDFIPTATFATGNDEQALPGPGNNPFQSGDIKFNIIFTQPLAKGLNLQLQQNRTSGYDVTIGSAIYPGGKLIIPGSINDVFEEARVNWAASKNIGVTIGDNYRWRECCPNAGQVGNETPTTWHGQYLQLALTSPANKALNGTSFALTGHWTYNLWHNSPAYQAFEAANGIRVNGGTARFPSWYGATATVPINSGVVIYGFYGVGAFDYFDNSVAPYYYDLFDAGLIKTVNKYISFVASIDTLSQQHLENNNPFLLPNALHRAYFATGLDIHIGK